MAQLVAAAAAATRLLPVGRRLRGRRAPARSGEAGGGLERGRRELQVASVISRAPRADAEVQPVTPDNDAAVEVAPWLGQHRGGARRRELSSWLSGGREQHPTHHDTAMAPPKTYTTDSVMVDDTLIQTSAVTSSGAQPTGFSGRRERRPTGHAPPHAMTPPPPNTYTTIVVMEDGTSIRTTVTSSGAAVERFLREIRRNQRHLIVGIDTEWRVVFDPDGKRSYRTAVLQLCVGRRCLVFQIVHADYVPEIALGDFFACPDHRFVGVEVGGDLKRLSEDYGFEAANAVELKSLAAEVLRRPELKQAGLKSLTREVMGVLIDKPKRVTMSKWDKHRLSREQVDYACIDAFTSYEVGRLLLSRQSAAATAATSSSSPDAA